MRELRKRFAISILALFGASAAIYVVYEPILDFLRAPLGQALYYDTPAGSFAFVMKLCAIGGLLVATPVLVYNIVMFIKPAFTDKISMKRIALISVISGLLAAAGAAFAYYVILHASLKFFGGFQVDGLQALLSADKYLNFVTNTTLTFMLIFQIPIIVSFINRIRPIKPRTMLKGEKWVILGSLVVSLIVPFAYDLRLSLLVSLPIFTLYNLAFIMVLISRLRSPIVIIEKAKEIKQANARTKVPKIGGFQLESALQPLDWMEEEKIAAPVFHNSPHRRKTGAMDVVAKAPMQTKVEPAEWFVRKQERLRMAQMAAYERPSKLISI